MAPVSEEQKRLYASAEGQEGVRADGRDNTQKAPVDEKRLNDAVERAIRDNWDAIKELAKY